MNTLIALTLVQVPAPPGFIDVRVIASTEGAVPQRIQAADIVFGWNTNDLRLVGLDNTGAIDTTCSCIPPSSQDYTGANEADPPADGNAIMWWLSPLTGIPVFISEGSHLTTIRFERLRPFDASEVRLIPSLVVSYEARTIVYGSNVPGSNVTGVLTPAIVSGCECDLDGNGYVDAADLAQSLAGWGGGEQLAQILSAWGPCPYRGDDA